MLVIDVQGQRLCRSFVCFDASRLGAVVGEVDASIDAFFGCRGRCRRILLVIDAFFLLLDIDEYLLLWVAMDAACAWFDTTCKGGFGLQV